MFIYEVYQVEEELKNASSNVKETKPESVANYVDYSVPEIDWDSGIPFLLSY